MSWDWDKLKQQQEPSNKVNLKGKKNNGFGTEIGYLIYLFISGATKALLILSAIFGLGFLLGLGFHCAGLALKYY